MCYAFRVYEQDEGGGTLNSMKHLQAQEEARAKREAEERRIRLENENRADMLILHALLDAERQAREIEDGAQEYRSGLEARLQAKKDELLQNARQAARAAIIADSNAERERAEQEIRREKEQAGAVRERLRLQYETRREGYVRRVFDIVTGQRDE